VNQALPPIYFGSRAISPQHPCFIAAEIGINHNGDMDLALRSIEAAAAAGADGVKFQNYETADFLSDESLTYTYQSQGKEVTESQWAMFKRCELTERQLETLRDHCNKLGVVFFSTPTSERGVDTLVRLDSMLIKNGSDYLTNLELIRHMAATGRPTVLSTGMATVGEIDDAVSAYRGTAGASPILLHCTSSYPTLPQDVNLSRIPVLASTFGCHVGFSDHSEGTAAAVGARVLGACFLEKHFTLDNNLPGPDHRFSCSPTEFRDLVQAVRSIEFCIGDQKLGPTEAELTARQNFRLSCLASADIKAGTVLGREHIAFMRPGTGIAPKDIDALLGATIRTDVKRGHIFSWGDFK
jgi:N,N'-diacetyllegionaminate synthase